MGLDFVGNPNKIDYEDTDDIVGDDYSDDENFELFNNEWVEIYESSDSDDDYEPFEDFLSDSDTSSVSECPSPLDDTDESLDEEVLQKGETTTTTTTSTATTEKSPSESAEANPNENNSNT